MCVNDTFIKTPNLPTAKVTFAAVSGIYEELPMALAGHGIKTILTESDPRLQMPVAHHADMQLFHIGDNRTFVLSGQKTLKEQLEQSGFLVAETMQEPQAEYPGDVLCNALYLGNTVFANLGSMDANICAALDAMGVRTIHVNQGYAHCTTAVLNERAVITMDSGIYAAAQFFGIDVLLIPERAILLEGHDYGFIGGCCGLIDKNVLAFTGRLDSLNCVNQVRAFLDKHGVIPVELTQNQMLDVGGIIPLKQAL